MPFFKYVVPERIDSIRSRRVRFTQAAALNDPFEANPCFDVLRKSFEDRQRAIVEGLKGKEPEYRLVAAEIRIPLKVREGVDNWQREMATGWPMLSLTSNRNHLLMWAHYADCHRGFVIGFDHEHSFFHRTSVRPISSISEVHYSKKRPLVPRFEEIPDNFHEILFLTKSEHWAYEAEFRMFAKPEFASAPVERDHRGHEIYLFDVPGEAFVEIIFGYRMSIENKEELAALARNNYPNLGVFEARLHDTDFALEIAPYTANVT